MSTDTEVPPYLLGLSHGQREGIRLLIRDTAIRTDLSEMAKADEPKSPQPPKPLRPLRARRRIRVENPAPKPPRRVRVEGMTTPAEQALAKKLTTTQALTAD